MTITATTSEQVNILRYRAGLNQTEYAASMGVSVRRVMAWEKGDVVPPDLGPVELSLGEQARVLRRRLGLTIHGVAKLMDLSHVTIINIERNRSKLAGRMLETLLSLQTKDDHDTVQEGELERAFSTDAGSEEAGGREGR